MKKVKEKNINNHDKSDKLRLCFYVGYTVNLNEIDSFSTDGFYGSELALIKLSELFAKKYDVHVFGTSQRHCVRNNVQYHNSDTLNQFMMDYDVEIMIVSRYVHYFIEFTHRAKQLYIWTHDLTFQPFWRGHSLPDNAKYCVANNLDKINGVIALSPTHKLSIVDRYGIDSSKIFIIGNGIDPEDFDLTDDYEKTKNRFIWTSASNRGLAKCIEYIEEIKKYVPDLTFYVFRDEKDVPKELIEKMDETNFMFFKGSVSNALIIKEFEKSEYWFYPTYWSETYCISALEAQLTRCVCICSDLGALSDTVGERGILLKSELHSEEYRQEAIDAVVSVINNPKRKFELTKNARKWAVKQTWESRALEWISLFEKME